MRLVSVRHGAARLVVGLCRSTCANAQGCISNVYSRTCMQCCADCVAVRPAGSHLLTLCARTSVPTNLHTLWCGVNVHRLSVSSTCLHACSSSHPPTCSPTLPALQAIQASYIPLYSDDITLKIMVFNVFAFAGVLEAVQLLAMRYNWRLIS